jgi:hypothetical protein
MTATFEQLQRSAISFIGALAFTALLVVASAPHVPLA